MNNEFVIYKSETVLDEYGESCHEVVEDLNGNVLLSQRSGDWTSSMPDAHGCKGKKVEKSSLTWLSF